MLTATNALLSKIISEMRRQGDGGEEGDGRGRRGGGRNGGMQLVKSFFRTPRCPAGDINPAYSTKNEKKHWKLGGC